MPGTSRQEPEEAPVRDDARKGGPAPRTRFSWWHLSNWRLRRKMLVVLLVPLVTAVALGALRVTGQLRDANVYDEISEQIALSDALSDVMDNVQREREQSTLYVASGKQGATSADVTGKVDAAVEAFRRRANADTDLSPEVRTLVQNALDDLNDLQSVRTTVASSSYPEIGVLSVYDRIMDTLLQSSQLISTAAPDSRINQLASGLNALRTAKDQLTRANTVLVITVAPRSDQSTGFITGTQEILDTAKSEYQAAINSYNASSTPQNRQMFLDTVTGRTVDQRAQLQSQIEATAAGNGGPTATTSAVENAGQGTADLLHAAEKDINGQLNDLADSLASSAKTQAWRDGGIVAAALLIAFLVTLLVARSVVRSLRRLRLGAIEVASTRLPQSVQRILADPDPVEASKQAVTPVPIFTTEEVGQVARSFDAVHEQAIRLAAEQALLRDNINSIFVNLSRRSQTLVERQLNLIDRLEQDEQDPDQLASLFELDHLATRMRRNSESLLVLSGTGLSRQLARPVPAAEVVGAAVSEVEQYARIEVALGTRGRGHGPRRQRPRAPHRRTAGQRHAFSEPEKKVNVRLAVTRKKELAVQITDQGVGMSAEDIDAANQRLADPPDMDVAVTRRMGLYVVARLAKRHNIIVRLRDNEDIEGGLIARITVPSDLMQPMRGSLASVTSTSLSGSMPSISSATTAIPTSPPSKPAEPQVKTGGIADAFSSSTTRLRRDNAPTPPPAPADEPRWPERTGEQPTTAMNPPLGGFSPLDPSDSNTSIPLPKRGPRAEQPTQQQEPVSPVPTGLPEPEPPRPVEQSMDFGAALFGEPMPEPDYTDQEPSQPAPQPDPVIDAPTERLPIYEAVLSQWFEATDSEAMPAPPQPSTNGNGNGSHPPTAEDSADERAAAWQSPGDEGWQAAQALLSPKEEEEASKTTAGLPKRVPKQHLVPGSAAPRHTQEQRETHEEQQERPTPLLPPRSAEAIRGRMSSFQQGLRRGRHALIEAYPGDRSGSSRAV